MQLDTERLILHPLTAKELRLWLSSPEELESLLGVRYDAEEVDDWFKKLIEGQLDKILSDPDDLLFHTFWWIIKRDSHTVVGSCDFKAPSENDRVEIGYGLGERHFHKGFMTETVAEMCRFAFSTGIKEVIAETEKENIASQKVLKRCGFEIYDNGETLWWSKSRDKKSV